MLHKRWPTLQPQTISTSRGRKSIYRIFFFCNVKLSMSVSYTVLQVKLKITESLSDHFALIKTNKTEVCISSDFNINLFSQEKYFGKCWQVSFVSCNFFYLLWLSWWHLIILLRSYDNTKIIKKVALKYQQALLKFSFRASKIRYTVVSVHLPCTYDINKVHEKTCT